MRIRLATFARVIVFDTRSTGLSEHSYGGLVAPIAAYSFRDVDALVGIGSAFDQGLPPGIMADVMPQIAAVCGRGGEQKRFGEPSGYVFTFPGLPDGWWHDPEPAAVGWATDRLERDACGDLNSMPTALAVNRTELATIDVPVLLMCMEFDVLWTTASCTRQADLYAGNADVALVSGSGHGVMLERPARDFRTALSSWLAARGF